MATVREFVVEMSAETDTGSVQEYASSLKGATGAAATLAAGAATLAAAIGGTTAALAQAATAAGRFGRRISKQADMAGTSVPNIQAITGALQKYGVQQDQAAEAIREFNVRLGEAARGEGEAAEAFNQLNIATKNANGQIRDSSEVFDEALSKLSEIDNSARRAALSEKLLGGQSEQLASVINEGGVAIDEYRQRLDELGITMSEQAANRAKDFQADLGLLRKTFKGIWREIGVEVIPVFQQLINGFLDLIAANRNLISRGIDAFILGFTKMIGWIIDGIEIIIDVGQYIVGLGDKFEQAGEKSQNWIRLLGLLATMASPIASLVAVVTDVINVLSGGESVIMRNVRAVLEWLNILDTVKTSLFNIGNTYIRQIQRNWNRLIQVVKLLQPVINIIVQYFISAFKIIKAGISPLITAFSIAGQVIMVIWQLVSNFLINRIIKFLKFIQPALKAIKEGFIAISDPVVEAWKGIFDWIQDQLEKVAGWLNKGIKMLERLSGQELGTIKVGSGEVEGPETEEGENEGGGSANSQSSSSDSGSDENESGQESDSSSAFEGLNLGKRGGGGKAASGLDPTQMESPTGGSSPQKVDNSINADITIEESDNPEQTRRIVRDEMEEVQEEQKKRYEEMKGGQEVGEKGGGS
jgi:hypothetical protein